VKSRRNPFVYATLAGVTAFLAVSGAWKVIAQSQQAPVFRSKVDLVQLEVSVLDKNRKPIRGLTKSDFAVSEDGRSQEVAIFKAIDVPDPEPPPVAWMRDITPDVSTNEEKVTRLWVIAIDDALIPTNPWVIKSSRKIVEDIIDKFGPQDLATIVYTADSRKAQDFTNDRTKLRATLDHFNPGFATWTNGGNDNLRLPVDSDLHFMIGSVATVLNIVNTMKALPNERKGLIWVTPGVPLDSEVAMTPVKAPNPHDSNWDIVMGGQDAHIRLLQLTKEVFETARLANVPVYPIDPCGLGGLAAMVGGRKPGRAMDHILMTAANTGGHAIVNTNDFTPGIESIFDENKSFYLIGYYPTNGNADGTLRRLDVKVNRAGADVRTRSSYYAPTPGEAAPKNSAAQLATAVAAPIPVTDLPMRAAVAPFAIPGKGHLAAVTIALGVRQPVPESAATGRITVSTDLQVTAFTTEGDKKGSQRSIAKVVLRAGAKGDADYEALSRIDLPPGRYRLRLAAYHESAGKAGTVMADVLVPDFNRDSASMSGVIISATPGRPSAPRDLFKEIVPIVPTAQRAFGAKDQVTALFDLYQNAGRGVVPARVAIRITNSENATVVDESQTLGTDRFVRADSSQGSPASSQITGGSKSIPAVSSQPRPDLNAIAIRAAEFQYKLPMSRLTPGRFLLTFEVTIGEAVFRRDVLLEIRGD